MAKKLKEDINLDEIDENFIISSFKTGGKVQASATDTAKEKRDGCTGSTARTKPAGTAASGGRTANNGSDEAENRETGKGKNGDCRSTAKGS